MKYIPTLLFDPLAHALFGHFVPGRHGDVGETSGAIAESLPCADHKVQFHLFVKCHGEGSFNLHRWEKGKCEL